MPLLPESRRPVGVRTGLRALQQRVLLRSKPWQRGSGSEGRKRNPNPNFLVRISSSGVGVFHVNERGPKSSACPSKPRETKLFRRDITGFCRDIPGVPEQFEKKEVCVQFSSPTGVGCRRCSFMDCRAWLPQVVKVLQRDRWLAAASAHQ